MKIILFILSETLQAIEDKSIILAETKGKLSLAEAN